MNNPRGSLDYVTICCLRLLWDEIYDNWVKVAQDAGLTVTEEQILLAIWLSEESTVTEVAFLLQRDKGTVSKGVYSLERNGLVERKTGQRSSLFAVYTDGDGTSCSVGISRETQSRAGIGVCPRLFTT